MRVLAVMLAWPKGLSLFTFPAIVRTYDIHICIYIYIYIYVTVSSNPFRHAEICNLHESVRSQWAILAAFSDVADFFVKSQLQLVLRQEKQKQRCEALMRNNEKQM